MLGQYGVDRLQMKLVDTVNALVTAPARRRETPLQFTMRVAGTEDLSPHQRRVTFTAPEFAEFGVTGPDEYFGLLIPHPTGLVMPDEHRMNTRQAVHRIADHERPELRWYTVRAHRPALTEIDVDFVVHEHGGPGTRWAAAAHQGERVGFRAGGSGYQRPTTNPQVLLADEAALPALSAILESLPADVPDLRVYVEVARDFTIDPIASSVQPTVLRRDGQPGDKVITALTENPPADADFAWLCGEAGMVAKVRRHLLHECAMDRRQVMFSGYWKLGQARG